MIDGEFGRIGPRGLEIGFDFGRDLVISGGDVVFLTDVIGQFVEFQRAAGFVADGLPLTPLHRLLEAVLVKFLKSAIQRHCLCGVSFQAPFADQAGAISGLLKNISCGDVLIGKIHAAAIALKN